MDDYDVFCTYFDKILPLSLTWDGNQLIFNGFDWQHIACAISSFSGDPLSDWMCSSGKDYIEDREKNGIIVKAMDKVKAADNPQQMLEEL